LNLKFIFTVKLGEERPLAEIVHWSLLAGGIC